MYSKFSILHFLKSILLKSKLTINYKFTNNLGEKMLVNLQKKNIFKRENQIFSKMKNNFFINL